MKQIKNYPNYSICENGNVINTKINKILKQSITKNGYNIVGISNGVRFKTVYIHRLIAEAFIPNTKNKMDVNHINGIKTDNRIQNLEWATRSENLLHAFKTGLKIHSELNIKNRRLNRIKLVLDTETGIFYDSATEAAYAKNIAKGTLIHKLLGYTRNFTSLKYV
jgi:hypothetical protein